MQALSALQTGLGRVPRKDAEKLRGVMVRIWPHEDGGLICSMEAPQERLGWIFRHVPRIVGWLFCLGPFKSLIIVSGAYLECFSISKILEVWPALMKRKGPLDRAHEMEILTYTQQHGRLEALYGVLLRDYSLFVIDDDGRYLDARIHAGTISRIPPEGMIGRTLAEVLPDGRGESIAAWIGEAIATGQRRMISYQLWERSYQSEVIPLAGEKAALVVCQRTA